MKPFGYFYHGLHVVCELPVSEWEFCRELPPDQPDVTVIIDKGLTALDGNSPPSSASGDTYRFYVYGVGEYEVCDGRRIAIRPEAGVPQSHVTLYLAGTAWAVLLYQRSRAFLHGSAIEFSPGRAALFCGRRGFGKSTLAASLCAAGYSLLSDDMCCLDKLNGVPVVYPSTPRLKLLRDTVQALRWQDMPSEAAAASPKLHFAAPHAAHKATPLAGLYVLGWGELGIRPLRGLDALRRIISAGTWRAGLLLRSGKPAHHIQKSVELVSLIPVWEFSRPMDRTRIPDGLRLLEQHLRQHSAGREPC